MSGCEWLGLAQAGVVGWVTSFGDFPSGRRLHHHGTGRLRVRGRGASVSAHRFAKMQVGARSGPQEPQVFLWVTPHSGFRIFSTPPDSVNELLGIGTHHRLLCKTPATPRVPLSLSKEITV